MGSDKPRVIGQRYTGCTDHTGRWHWEQPFVVLRAVDREAWRSWNASMGNMDPQPSASETAYFYEVSID